MSKCRRPAGAKCPLIYRVHLKERRQRAKVVEVCTDARQPAQCDTRHRVQVNRATPPVARSLRSATGVSQLHAGQALSQLVLRLFVACDYEKQAICQSAQTRCAQQHGSTVALVGERKGLMALGAAWGRAHEVPCSPECAAFEQSNVLWIDKKMDKIRGWVGRTASLRRVSHSCTKPAASARQVSPANGSICTRATRSAGPASAASAAASSSGCGASSWLLHLVARAGHRQTGLLESHPARCVVRHRTQC